MNKEIKIHNKRELSQVILGLDTPLGREDNISISNKGNWKWSDSKFIDDELYMIKIGNVLNAANALYEKYDVNKKQSIMFVLLDIERDLQKFYSQSKFNGTEKKLKMKKRISKIVNKLIKKDSTFKDLDKNRVSNFLQFINKNISFEQLESLSYAELTNRIEKALVIELIFGMLNDLTEEQRKTFKSIVER